MTQKEILNSLNPGEKIVDIQEHFHGDNGRHTVYQVTIYTCVKNIIGFKKLKTYTFPFYFVSMEFAKNFLEHYDTYEIGTTKYSADSWGDSHYKGYDLYLKNVDMQIYKYRMVDAYTKNNTPCSKCDVLKEGGVWSGIVNYKKQHFTEYIYSTPPFDRCNNMSYLGIINKEKFALKENTCGNSCFYKLQKIENNG